MISQIRLDSIRNTEQLSCFFFWSPSCYRNSKLILTSEVILVFFFNSTLLDLTTASNPCVKLLV